MYRYISIITHVATDLVKNNSSLPISYFTFDECIFRFIWFNVVAWIVSKFLISPFNERNRRKPFLFCVLQLLKTFSLATRDVNTTDTQL